MAQLDEESEEHNDSFDSDASADSYYERSFEAIENMETEIFRDSAIYSDPEDPEVIQEKPSNSPKSKSPLAIRSPKALRSANRNTVIEASTRILEVSDAAKRLSLSCSESPKKVPPPVPAKPDPVRSSRRPCGSLILQQLKNLEECSSKFQLREGVDPAVPALNGLSQRWNGGLSRESSLENGYSSNASSNAVSPCVVVAQGPWVARSPSNDPNDEDEPRVAKGWVRHVIGKLQAESEV